MVPPGTFTILILAALFSTADAVAFFPHISPRPNIVLAWVRRGLGGCQVGPYAVIPGLTKSAHLKTKILAELDQGGKQILPAQLALVSAAGTLLEDDAVIVPTGAYQHHSRGFLGTTRTFAPAGAGSQTTTHEPEPEPQTTTEQGVPAAPVSLTLLVRSRLVIDCPNIVTRLEADSFWRAAAPTMQPSGTTTCSAEHFAVLPEDCIVAGWATPIAEALLKRLRSSRPEEELLRPTTPKEIELLVQALADRNCDGLVRGAALAHLRVLEEALVEHVVWWTPRALAIHKTVREGMAVVNNLEQDIVEEHQTVPLPIVLGEE